MVLMIVVVIIGILTAIAANFLSDSKLYIVNVGAAPKPTNV